MSADIREVPAEKLTPADTRLEALFDDLEKESLKTLEEAARQIVTLSTALLAAFFGLLAFKDVPAFLTYADVKVLAALSLGGFFSALFYALDAVLPRRYTFAHADLTEKRRTLETMLSLKQTAVRRASWAFGIATLLMLAAALDILLFHI